MTKAQIVNHLYRLSADLTSLSLEMSKHAGIGNERRAERVLAMAADLADMADDAERELAVLASIGN